MMLKGSMIAIVTPMIAGVSPRQAVDFDSLRQLIEFHIENRADALIAIGTTGESPTLAEDEHCELIAWFVKTVAGRVPVITGTGSNATHEAITLTRAAHAAGADACLLVTPYYNKPTQEGLFQHYQAVAQAVPIPQILYNVPGRTMCDMLPATVARLAKIDNIIGIKDATAEIDRVAQLRELCGADFMLLSGDDATTLEFILAGGDGVISVTANVAPRAMHDMCALALAGDGEAAREINDMLMGLHEVLFVEPNPIPVKWALWRMDLIDRGIRLPLTWLSEELQTQVCAALEQAGISLPQR